MCIITDKNHIVISISLIPGPGPFPEDCHIYFPYNGNLPFMGEIFKPTMA